MWRLIGKEKTSFNGQTILWKQGIKRTTHKQKKLPCRLSKRQSMFTTVLFRTLTPMHHAPPTCETRVNLLRPLHMRPVDRAGPVNGMKAGWILTARMALSELALPAVFYRHKNPINCSDTAFRVAEVMMGAKVKISVFCHVCLVSRIWCQISAPDLSSRKLGWNFSYEPKAKFIPVTRLAQSNGLMLRSP